MIQIAYFSTAATPQNSEIIHRILETSRRNNLRDGISGLLVAGANRYMQVIEGPRLPMLALWAAIQRDERHLAVAKLFNRKIVERSFDGWTMAFRREPELDRYDSFPAALRNLTERIADTTLKFQIRKFAEIFIADPRWDVPAPWPMRA